MTPIREAAEECARARFAEPQRAAVDKFESIITRCVEAENEACAMVADNYANLAHVKGMHVQYDTARFLATAIRARSSDD